MYGVWLGGLPSVSNLLNTAIKFVPAYGLRRTTSPLRGLSAAYRDCYRFWKPRFLDDVRVRVSQLNFPSPASSRREFTAGAP